MSLNSDRITGAAKQLEDLLGPELSQIITYAQAEPGSPQSPFIMIPPSAVDQSPEELASLVARTANAYGRVARLAGMARAELALAEQRYKHKLKTSMDSGAKNKELREAKAMESAADEFVALSVIEAAVKLAESMEMATRIASESSRKLFDKNAAMQTASAREERGTLADRDFSYGN